MVTHALAKGASECNWSLRPLYNRGEQEGIRETIDAKRRYRALGQPDRVVASSGKTSRCARCIHKTEYGGRDPRQLSSEAMHTGLRLRVQEQMHKKSI